METNVSVQFSLQNINFGDNGQNLRKGIQKLFRISQFYLILLLLTNYFVTDCRNNLLSSLTSFPEALDFLILTPSPGIRFLTQFTHNDTCSMKNLKQALKILIQ